MKNPRVTRLNVRVTGKRGGLTLEEKKCLTQISWNKGVKNCVSDRSSFIVLTCTLLICLHGLFFILRGSPSVNLNTAVITYETSGGSTDERTCACVWNGNKTSSPVVEITSYETHSEIITIDTRPRGRIPFVNNKFGFLLMDKNKVGGK